MIALRRGGVAHGFCSVSTIARQTRHASAVNSCSEFPISAKIEGMGDFKTVDPIIHAWAETRGLHVYTGHKQNSVRSMTVYIWIGQRHESTGHIWLDPPNEIG